MAGAKLIVIYPRSQRHRTLRARVPERTCAHGRRKLANKTKIVASKMVGSPQGTPPFNRITEIHFPTMEALQACGASDGRKQTIASTVAISSGGAPIFLIAEEEILVFRVE